MLLQWLRNYKCQIISIFYILGLFVCHMLAILDVTVKANEKSG